MWLIYALGGGWGHLTRAASLARAAAARNAVRILSNSPYLERVRAAIPDLDIAAVATREDAVREIRRAAPSCLIIDTFPRGIGGELVEVLDSVAAKKVLVHRDLNPKYVAAFGLLEFVAKHFDLVLLPGEGTAFPGVATAPWLIRSWGGLQSARDFSPAAGRRPATLVCPSGKPTELEWYRAVAGRLGVDLIDRWPAMDLFAGASAVVGGGGYNTVHECLALGVPLVARAWPRKYDRQALRLERAAGVGTVVRVETPDQAAGAVSALPPPSQPQPFTNGVHDAVRLIEQA